MIDWNKKTAFIIIGVLFAGGIAVFYQTRGIEKALAINGQPNAEIGRAHV